MPETWKIVGIRSDGSRLTFSENLTKADANDLLNRVMRPNEQFLWFEIEQMEAVCQTQK